MEYVCPMGKFRAIKANESIADIANEYDMTATELLISNPGLNPTYYLSGQIIIVPDKKGPGFGIYTVNEGDGLSDILRKADISAAELIKLNPNKDIFALSSGDKLMIPLHQIDAGKYHMIEESENLSTLASRFCISPLQLLKLNPNLRPSEFTSGQTIRISNS